MRTVIIDDEGKARQVMCTLIIKHCPQLEIVGEAASVADGIGLIKNEKPMLVFLDVKMKDGSGFDLLDAFENVDFQVIFVTAFDEFAIRAFQYNAIYYLLKPVILTELVEACNRALELPEKPNGETWQKLRDEVKRQKIDRLALPTQTGFQIVSPDDIIRCQADDYYTHFHFRDGQEVIVSRTLKFYENLLTEKDFLRVHQSHLINLKEVVEYRKHYGGMLVLSNGEEIPVSNSKKEQLFLYLNYK